MSDEFTLGGCNPSDCASCGGGCSSNSGCDPIENHKTITLTMEDDTEVECAVLENGGDVKASCIGQILSAEEFYSYSSKYTNVQSKTLIPADISKEKQEEVRKLAIKAFKAVGARGISRVDFFVEKNTDEVYINEINTMPGFTQISMYPQLWEACGLSYTELLDKLVENALEK